MGCLQAAEAIKIITKIGDVMFGKLLLLNLLSMDKKELFIKHLFDKHSFKINKPISETNFNSTEMIKEINAIELKHRMDDPKDTFFVLDVREPDEFDQYNIGGTIIPLGKLPERLQEVPSDQDIVVICKSGVRSHRAALYIAENLKHSNIFNLKGGLMSWFAETNASKK